MESKKPVVWFEIYVDDMERATKFYEDVLDVKLKNLPNPTNDPLQMKTFPSDMEHYGSDGALVKMDDMAAGGNSILVYFASEDCTIEENRIEKAGGRVLRPKMSIGEHGFVTLAHDTEGNMFGLHSQK